MSWLPSRTTDSPDEGFNLAIKLSRMGVKTAQPDDKVREKLRAVYENDANALTAVSHVVAVNFQTISAANNYWK